MTDANVNKLIIVTQTPPPANKKGEPKRPSSSKQLTAEMETGLRRYEEELWSAEAKKVSSAKRKVVAKPSSLESKLTRRPGQEGGHARGIRAR